MELVAKVPAYEVVEEKCALVDNVGEFPDGRAAGVHADAAGLEGLENVLRAGESVMKSKTLPHLWGSTSPPHLWGGGAKRRRGRRGMGRVDQCLDCRDCLGCNPGLVSPR